MQFGLDVIHPIDLMFLIDGSINAGVDNFNKQLTFVRKLCNRLVKVTQSRNNLLVSMLPFIQYLQKLLHS